MEPKLLSESLPIVRDGSKRVITQKPVRLVARRTAAVTWEEGVTQQIGAALTARVVISAVEHGRPTREHAPDCFKTSPCKFHHFFESICFASTAQLTGNLLDQVFNREKMNG